MNERMGARPWVAHTQADQVRMLLRRNAEGDRERAERLLSRAQATYRELGMSSPPRLERSHRSGEQGEDAAVPRKWTRWER